MRAKQGLQPTTAESPQAMALERASPKRTLEDGVRESGGGSSSSRRRIVDVDFEARQEAAAALYTAWRQHTLTTTTNTSPKRALDHGAQEDGAKRGGGQRRLVNPRAYLVGGRSDLGQPEAQKGAGSHLRADAWAASREGSAAARKRRGGGGESAFGGHHLSHKP